MNKIIHNIFISIFCLNLLILGGPSVLDSFFLNVANFELSKWSAESRFDKALEHLTNAVRWGERAGPKWSAKEARVQALWSRMTDAAAQSKQVTQKAYKQGHLLEEQNELDAALEHYVQATMADEGCVKCRYALYKLAAHQEQKELAQQQLDALIELYPRYHLGIALEGNIELIGYDLDEIELERDLNPIPITFYWQLPTLSQDISSWEEGSWKYFQIHNRLYQVGLIENLLPNGGFEFSLYGGAVLPFGYHNTSTHANQNLRYLQIHHQLDLMQRDPVLSQVAIVVNPTEMVNGLTTIEDVFVKPNHRYILAGWLKAAGDGSGYLGGIWRTENKSDIGYWYAVENYADETWKYISVSVTSPDTAAIFTPLLTNRHSGRVYFDNLVFFELSVPESK
jgi:tetratricopeptide (TPR) repeat protein